MDEATRNATISNPRTAREAAAGFTSALAGFEMPEAFRVAAAQWIGQTQNNLAKAFSATDELNKVSERIWSATARSTTDGAAKMAEVMHQNANAGFDFVRDLVVAKSSAEALEISTAYARKHFEMLAGQNKQLWSWAHQMTIGIVGPVTDALPRAFQPTSQI